MKSKWFKFVNGGLGSRRAHAHLKTDSTGEIEFQCGLQRHMDDTILAPRGSKRCPRCEAYLRHPKKEKEEKKRRLRSGRYVPELREEVKIVSSKCPEKWVCVDLETSNTWVRTDRGYGNYRRPTKTEVDEAIRALKNPG